MRAICTVYDDDDLEICVMEVETEQPDDSFLIDRAKIQFKNSLKIGSLGFNKIWNLWRSLKREI